MQLQRRTTSDLSPIPNEKSGDLDDAGSTEESAKVQAKLTTTSLN